MFKELIPVLKHRPLTITVALLAGGKIRACVIPQPLESDGKVNEKITGGKEVAKIPESVIKALTTPLAVTGTAEELDAGLAQQLTMFAEHHVLLHNGLEQATSQILEALKAIQERDKNKSRTKIAGAAPQGPSDDEKRAKQEPEAAQPSLLPDSWVASPNPSGSSNQT